MSLSKEQIEAHRLYLRRAMQRLGRESEPLNEALCDMALKALHPEARRAIPSEPTHDMLKALAGDPVILAASDEEELRRRYKAMVGCCMASIVSTQDDPGGEIVSDVRWTLETTSHTPGPWKAEQPSHDPQAWDVCTQSGGILAKLVWGHQSADNARLMAAAPDLLKVSDMLYDAVDMMMDGPDDSDVAYAEGKLAEAFKLAREIRKQIRGEKS